MMSVQKQHPIKMEGEFMFCASCHESIPEARRKALPNATLCVQCVMGRGDVLPLRRLDEHMGEDVVETLFTENRAFDAQIHRERTHAIAPKTLSECTEAEPVGAKSAELKADERSNNTAFAILSDQEEHDEEEK